MHTEQKSQSRFRERVEQIWELVRNDADALGAAVAIAGELNEEVRALVEREGLSV